MLSLEFETPVPCTLRKPFCRRNFGEIKVPGEVSNLTITVISNLSFVKLFKNHTNEFIKLSPLKKFWRYKAIFERSEVRFRNGLYIHHRVAANNRLPVMLVNNGANVSILFLISQVREGCHNMHIFIQNNLHSTKAANF